MEDTELLLRNAMEHHGAAVYRLALCRMQSVQDAEDVYQDVFLRLLGQDAASWNEAHLRAWLLRCHDEPVLRSAPLPPAAAGAGPGGPAGDRGGAGQRAPPSCGTRWPGCRRAAHPHPPVLCRGIFHGGDRRAAGHPGGHGPAPGSAGPGTNCTTCWEETTMKKNDYQNMMEHIQPPRRAE